MVKFLSTGVGRGKRKVFKSLKGRISSPNLMEVTGESGGGKTRIKSGVDKD